MNAENEMTGTDPVRAQTDRHLLEKIDAGIEERIRFYAAQPDEVISRRIEELDQEWDLDRCLETNASALALSGLFLAVLGKRKWFLFSAGVLGTLLQHALKGTSWPVPWLRRLGIRTRSEIDREKYALKILRGDFQSVAADPEQLRRNPASDVLGAVSS
jgi:hypothetical protein